MQPHPHCTPTHNIHTPYTHPQHPHTVHPHHECMNVLMHKSPHAICMHGHAHTRTHTHTHSMNTNAASHRQTMHIIKLATLCFSTCEQRSTSRKQLQAHIRAQIGWRNTHTVADTWSRHSTRFVKVKHRASFLKMILLSFSVLLGYKAWRGSLRRECVLEHSQIAGMCSRMYALRR